LIEVEASRAATAARLEGAAFGGWITSDVPLPLAGPSGAAPRLSLQVREGRPYRRWPGDLPLARLGAVPAIEGDVSPSSGTVWLRPTSAGPGVVWGAVLGLALPHVAHACGTHVLHASCVSRGCRAVAFLGGPRSGKSSAAAALVRRGWRLVSDDALPVTAGFDGVLAQPAFPAIRLFTPMATWFAEGDPGRMLPVHPRLQKWWAHVDQARQWHGSEPVPLRCLCLLDRSGQPGGRLPG
jgi:hypothetical protein